VPKDPTVQVAFIGVVTTFITTIGVILVAVMNNKRERRSAADVGVEVTLRERLTLRDEQIAELREDKADLRERLDAALEEVQEKTALVVMLQQELQQCKEGRT
jgi:hypothetical protein